MIKKSTWDYYEIVETLIDKSADVNAKNKNGKTALMRASWNGRISEIKLLIVNGAYIDAKSNHGTTHLMAASEANQIEVLKIFLSRKININAGNNIGLTGLMVACRKGNVGVARLLISDEALVASTLNSAYSIDMANRVGSLDIGKQADFLLLDSESQLSSRITQAFLL